MSSEERMRKRQFSQVYGVYGNPNTKPLKIDIISETTLGNQEASIYLLIHNDDRAVSAVGFSDLNRSFSFAFTKKEIAENFVSAARKQNLLTQVSRILPMTVGEYFERKNQGWTTSDLCIDPNPSMLTHPNLKLGIQNSN